MTQPPPGVAEAAFATDHRLPSDFDVLLPVIRIGSGERGAQLLAVYCDSLIVGRVKRFVPLPASLVNDPSKAALLSFKDATQLREIQLSEVQQARIDLLGTLLPKSRLTLTFTSGAAVVHRIPLSDSLLLVEALRLVLGDRFVVDAEFQRRLALWMRPEPAKPTKYFQARQWRHAPLGIALKVVGVALILASFAWANLRSVLLPKDVAEFDAIVPWSLVIAAAVMGLASLSIGYRLALVSGARVLAEDARKPIVYLRGFYDEARVSFHPSGYLAQLLGAEWSPFSPLRALRMVLSRGSDRADEQLATFFASRGPLVAIGNPTDRLPPGGAARLYLGPQASWQDEVLRLLSQAQIVLLQPAATAGVRWEIQQARTVPREHLLLLLGHHRLLRVQYEDLRFRLWKELQFVLPLAGEGTAFAMFEQDFRPRLLPLQYRSPFAWPFGATVIDFARTLEPFLARLERRKPTFQSSRSAVVFQVHAVLAVIAWYAGVIGTFAATGGWIRSAWSALPKASTASAAEVTQPVPVAYTGELLPIAFTLDGAWKLANADSTPTVVERVFTLGDPPLIALHVIEGLPQRTGTRLTEAQLFGLQSMGMLAHLGPSWKAEEHATPLQVRGRTWSRYVTSGVVNGIGVRYTTIIHMGERGWMVVQLITPGISNDSRLLSPLLESFDVEGLHPRTPSK